MAPGVGAAGAHRLADREEDDPCRAEGEVGQGGERNPRDRRQRHPRRDLAHHADAVRGEVQGRNRQDPQHEHDQRPGHARRDPAQDQDHGQRHQADRERVGVGVRQLADQLDDLLRQRAAQARHAQDLGQLADDDRDREPSDEARHDGLGEEVRDEPELREPGRDEDHADHQREGGRERQVARRVAPRQADDDRGGHHGHGGAGGHLEVAARPEDRVDGEGREGGHQPQLGRHAGQPRVGEGHRDHHAPRGQGGGEVAPAATPAGTSGASA